MWKLTLNVQRPNGETPVTDGGGDGGENGDEARRECGGIPLAFGRETMGVQARTDGPSSEK